MPDLILPNTIVVDVSHWDLETTADWTAAKAATNIAGVLVKFTQNGNPDPLAIQQSYDAYEAGILLLGGYDFGTPVDDSAAFLAQMGKDYGGDLRTRLLMLDAERNSPQMTVAEAEQWVEDIFAEQGRYPVLYMGRTGPDGTGVGLPSAILSKCDLMLPAYGPHEDNLGAILPPGFRLPTSDTDRGGCLRLWQFTDGKINGGPVPGLGPVDQSKIIGFSSLEALTAWWGT
jgi:hypothetical protein